MQTNKNSRSSSRDQALKTHAMCYVHPDVCFSEKSPHKLSKGSSLGRYKKHSARTGMGKQLDLSADTLLTFPGSAATSLALPPIAMAATKGCSLHPSDHPCYPWPPSMLALQPVQGLLHSAGAAAASLSWPPSLQSTSAFHTVEAYTYSDYVGLYINMGSNINTGFQLQRPPALLPRMPTPRPFCFPHSGLTTLPPQTGLTPPSCLLTLQTFVIGWRTLKQMDG